ncbi:MAG: SNF2-related protein [archaeon]|nr:SNF2-related protein [archaeon]
MFHLMGKHSDASLEKYVIKLIRENKRQKIIEKEKKTPFGISAHEKQLFIKLKKEPEKNQTHWDNLLKEMKWMASDFDKERKSKMKNALTFVKGAKKALDSKQIERQKNIRRQENNLQKKYQFIARSVKNYWQKIDKITKYNYNNQLEREKLALQQNRLIAFINKLEKISSKVVTSLDPSVNKKIAEQSSSLNAYSDITKEKEKSDKDNLSVSVPKDNEDEFNIIIKKHEDGTYSFMENTYDDEAQITKAAHCAELLQPKGTELKDANIQLKQPFLLNNLLREYQLIGLHWLVALHDNHINGILADEMGLGKTIQTIALFAYLAANRGNWGPHLIIVPTTIIVNWEIEFKKWCPSFKILSYYGNQKERKLKRYGWHKPNAFHVCITSYKLVIQDYSIFKRKRWYYIVLDEAQNIKNFKSKRWQMMLNFRAKRKLLLTGTPLQNDIMEIWSYLHFLMPNLFYSNEEFREWFHSQFYNAIHNNAALSKQIIDSLHSILRPFLLRRLKKDVEKQLPAKIEHVVYCELSRRQKYLYDEYINTDITQDTLKKNDYFSIMNVLMQLRKVCNHPDLFDSRDYMTSVKSCFEIYFYFPYLAYNIFEYDPLKSISFRNLKLILSERENMNTWDYLNLLKYFPEVPLFEIYDKINNNERQLYQPKYIIDENDITFRKIYSDNTILKLSNSDNLQETVFRMILNNSSESTEKKEEKVLENVIKNFHNFPNPNYICPTNIPLLQNTSLTNYFDMFYDIDQNDFNDPQPYLKSIFAENIKENKMEKRCTKIGLLHSYDLNSRLDILSSKPIFGKNCLKIMKLSFFLDGINSPYKRDHIIYGKEEKGMSYVIDRQFNNGWKYLKMKAKDPMMKITELSDKEIEEEIKEEEKIK